MTGESDYVLATRCFCAATTESELSACLEKDEVRRALDALKSAPDQTGYRWARNAYAYYLGRIRKARKAME